MYIHIYVCTIGYIPLYYYYILRISTIADAFFETSPHIMISFWEDNVTQSN